MYQLFCGRLYRTSNTSHRSFVRRHGESIKGNFYSLDHFPTSLKVCHVSSNKLQENGWYIHSYVSIHKIVQLLEVAMFLFSEATPILMEKNHHKTGKFFYSFFTEQFFCFLIHSAVVLCVHSSYSIALLLQPEPASTIS